MRKTINMQIIRRLLIRVDEAAMEVTGTGASTAVEVSTTSPPTTTTITATTITIRVVAAISNTYTNEHNTSETPATTHSEASFLQPRISLLDPK